MFNDAGNELALKAIEEPGKYLITLQKLKTASENKKLSISTFREMQKVLLSFLPQTEKNPRIRQAFQNEMNSLYLNKFTGYE